ncbi:MAG: glutathione S-transferase family protein [Gammaproteobacteria bacterium]|nr:glutathione S-transferase family protein [Gammaproteobacteria bacterium]
MTLTIYGPPMSRAMRTLWMAHELGLNFRHEYGFQEEALTPTEDLVAANPMGQVPAIDDDGFTLSESMAINIYLAKKHGKLAPATPVEEAQTLRWSFWVMTAVEVTLLDVLLKARGLRGHEKDPEAAKAGIDTLQKPFNVLNDALAGGDYLLGNAFTVADLNVASVFAWARAANIDFSQQPHLDAWLERCLAREAAVWARS